MNDLTATEPPPRKPSKTKGWGLALGIGLAALLHCALFGAAVLFDAPRLFYLIGVVQIAYLTPAWIILRRRGYKLAALGLVTVAAVTFLLSGACFATVGLNYF